MTELHNLLAFGGEEMKTGFIPISDCKEGAILAESVLNRYGVEIIIENTVLNDYIINKLIKLGVQQVKIYDYCTKDDCTNEKSNYNNIKKSYSENILHIKSIVNELAMGKPLDISKLNSISDIIYSGIHESTHVLKVLNEERSFDEYTYTHSLNVAFYSMLMGKWLRLGDDNIKKIIKAGLLHDIGKTKIPIEILNKNAGLSYDEFEVVKKHTLYGYDLIRTMNYFSEEVCNAVLSHHEREDKSGYPFGICGKQIDIYSKIIAIADVYDAMTSDRIYKKKSTPFEVFDMFQIMGVKKFDTKIIRTFLTNLSTCYVDSKVVLDTGEIGEVVYIPLHSIAEPVISIGSDYLDLAKSKERRILCIL